VVLVHVAALLFCSTAVDPAAAQQDGNLSELQMAVAGIGLIIAGNDTSGLGITASPFIHHSHCCSAAPAVAADTAHPAAALQDGNLSEQEMADAGIGLIIAGNDTSGLGISALLAILPLFPKVLERLRQEQQEVRTADWFLCVWAAADADACSCIPLLGAVVHAG
jgi:cytochrome P450